MVFSCALIILLFYIILCHYIYYLSPDSRWALTWGGLYPQTSSIKSLVITEDKLKFKIERLNGEKKNYPLE